MKNIVESSQPWDERQFGASEADVVVADPQHEEYLDQALGLQPISIRLPRDLIRAYKLIASHHGVGYQPLMRDILQRFVKEGLKEVYHSQSEKSDQAQQRIDELKKVA